MVDEAQDAISGVGAGTHTAAPEAAPADLFGGTVQAEPVKAVGSRAGRPNKLSRIMAAKVENEHGTTVLQAMVGQGMASLPDLAREAIDAAKAIAKEMGRPEDWRELVKDAVSVGALRRYRLECLATAAPYLHAKRAPENGKGQMQPVVMMFGGMSSADLGRSDGAFSDDAMVIDLEAEVLAAHEQKQALSDARASSNMEGAAHDGEICNDHNEVAP